MTMPSMDITIMIFPQMRKVASRAYKRHCVFPSSVPPKYSSPVVDSHPHILEYAPLQITKNNSGYVNNRDLDLIFTSINASRYRCCIRNGVSFNSDSHNDASKGISHKWDHGAWPATGWPFYVYSFCAFLSKIKRLSSSQCEKC